MIRLFSVCLLILGLNYQVSNAQSQTFVVSGVICDSISGNGVSNATLNIHYKSSNILLKSETTNQGRFVFHLIDTGKYILSIEHINFKKEFEVNISKNTSNPLDTIWIVPDFIKLKEVVIKAEKIKKDTVEFDTRKYVVDLNSYTKTLFTKLPGMILTKKGKLFFQGTEITKLFVDGEPFFENGPGTALEFLRSGAISKVQIFYKNHVKIVNIILKPNAKKGYFGGLESIAGIQDVLGLQATMNSFNKKMRIGVSGLFSSLGNASVNWNNPKNIELNNEIFSTLKAMPAFLKNNTTYSFGDGIPTTNVGNFFYSNKWGKSKIKLEYNNSFSETSSLFKIVEKKILQELASLKVDDGNNKVNKSGHNLSFDYEINLADSSRINVSSQSFIGNYESKLSSKAVSYNNANFLINDQNTEQYTNGRLQILNNKINWDKTYKKSTFLISFKQSYLKKDGINNTYNITTLYKDKNIDVIDTLDQNRNLNAIDQSYFLFSNYAVNITDKFKMTVDLTLGTTLNNSNIITYKKINDRYSVLDTALSNQSIYNNNLASIKYGLNYKFEKVYLDMGVDYTHNMYVQDNISKKTKDLDQYSNVSPFLTLECLIR